MPNQPPHQHPSSLRAHAQCHLVPAMGSEEYRAFRADIEARGLQVALEVTPAGVILDGHQRLRAARELSLERVPTRVVEPADELEYLLLAALSRRQLSASQRAALAVELDRYRETREWAAGRQRANLRQNATEGAALPPRGKTRDQAAAWAGVSPRTIDHAATVQRHDPELFQRVKDGQVKAATAARQIQRRLRDSALPAPPALPEGPFELVYADPPWAMGNPDSAHAPEQHYPTLPTQEIAALPVPAAEQAVLFLWAVSSMLPEALEVMGAWGFPCKSTMVWVKPSIKLGVWARNRHELLLIGRRGSFPPPEPEDRADSVIEAACGAHSAKPHCVYERLERMYPAATKLELFARGTPRPGWAAWGNQVEP